MIPISSKLCRNLRENILAVVAGSPSRDRLNSLIAVCHALARGFLASKASISRLSDFSGLSTSDISYDCIAELFRQDAGGRYLQLESYFSGIPLTTAGDAEILAHLRRLVFSKVNHSIFRLFGESDPTLAKILRNIKLAVSSLKNFTELDRFGEPCLSPGLCDSLEHLAPFERDELEKSFLQMTTGQETVPEMLSKLSLLLREQDDNCRIVPFITVALLIRSAYEHKHIHDAGVVTPDEELMSTYAQTVIRESCTSVQAETSEKYVGARKVPQVVFQGYFEVIEARLLAKLMDNSGNGLMGESLYEGMRKLSPELTKQDYSRIHRHRLEYLAKLVEKRVRKRLKKEGVVASPMRLHKQA